MTSETMRALTPEERVGVLSQVMLGWEHACGKLVGEERRRFFSLVDHIAALLYEADGLLEPGRFRRQMDAALAWRVEAERRRAAAAPSIEEGITQTLRRAALHATIVAEVDAFRRETDPLAGGARSTSIKALAEAFHRQADAEDAWRWAQRGRWDPAEVRDALGDADRGRYGWHPGDLPRPRDWYEPARHGGYGRAELLAVFHRERERYAGGRPERLSDMGAWVAWAREEAARNRDAARATKAPAGEEG